MVDIKKEREKVLKTYELSADKFRKKGYRVNPIYLATKALSEWFLIFKLGDISNKKVLNVGCWEPIDEIHFAKQVKEWVAIDINPSVIEMARSVAREELSDALYSKLTFKVEDTTNMSFEDESFDIVVSFSVIEHIPGEDNRFKALQEMVRVLKKGGYMIITVPNKLSTFYFAHKRNIRSNTSDYGYSYLYTPWELKKDMEKLNLKIVYFNSELEALRSLHSYFPSKLGLNRLVNFLKHFGERIGYLAQK
ncbi:MAG: class I SAM-dependent methyltransferase [bacterium]